MPEVLTSAAKQKARGHKLRKTRRKIGDIVFRDRSYWISPIHSPGFEQSNTEIKTGWKQVCDELFAEFNGTDIHVPSGTYPLMAEFDEKGNVKGISVSFI
jgi:hypothetical protein